VSEVQRFWVRVHLECESNAVINDLVDRLSSYLRGEYKIRLKVERGVEEAA